MVNFTPASQGENDLEVGTTTVIYAGFLLTGHKTEPKKRA